MIMVLRHEQEGSFEIFTAMEKLSIDAPPEIVLEDRISCQGANETRPFSIFFGESPSEFSFPLVLLEISAVILITRIIRHLLKPFKQPRIVSDILGGIMVGPSVLGRSKKFVQYLFPSHTWFLMKNVGIVGFMYFLFISGVKMDLSTIKKAGKKQWYIALFGVLIPIVTTLAVALAQLKYLDHEMKKGSSIWGVCSALAITAFPVLYPIIRELNLLSSEIGRMALATAVISDVIGINGVVAFEAAKQGEATKMAALWYIISLVVVMASIIGGTRQAMIWIVKTTPEGKPVEQVYIVAILLGVLAVGFVTDTTGLAIANGSLWLGLAVPDGPPLGATLVEKSETFMMEILMPFSYAYVGLITDVSAMYDNWKSLEPLFFMALTAYLMKFIATFLVTRFFEMPLRDGTALSLIMSLRGQVEILLFTHWMDFKMIGSPQFTMMVLLTTSVTAVATPIINILYDPTRPYMVNKRRNIQHNPPSHELRVVACVHDEESVAGILNLLEVSNPTLSSPFSVHTLHLIELVGRAAPVFIDHENEGPASDHTAQNTIHNAFQQFQETRSDLIKIHPFTSISPKRSMYQDICELALVKKASVIVLPFCKDYLQNTTGTELTSNSVVSVNKSVLTHAPCSVGVLVAKGDFRTHFPNTSSARRLSHHFAVLFLGGADSREALTYADRMTGNPGVSLTVIRFLSLNGEGDDEMEKKLDDGLVTWFWVKNEGGNQVFYREVVVRNGNETVAAIQAMNSEYFDLWIVGRKHGINPLIISGMDNWGENLELGVVGDYVASMDLGNRASVLVVQQQVLRDKDNESGGLLRRFSRSFNNRFGLC